jgi:ABC-2 type transport system permease protein
VTIFRFALIRGLRRRLTLLVLGVIPLGMIFIRPLWTSQYSSGLNLYGLVVLYTAFLLVRSIMTDRITKTVVRIFAAPVTTFQYLSQNLLAYLLLLAVQILVIVGLGAMMYGWDFPLTGKAILGYIVFGGTSIGFSLAWNSLFRGKEISGSVFFVVSSFMALLGGITVPLTILPELIKKIGMLFPPYWLASALFAIQEKGGGSDYWLSIAVLMLFTAAFLIFGSKRRLE